MSGITTAVSKVFPRILNSHPYNLETIMTVDTAIATMPDTTTLPRSKQNGHIPASKPKSNGEAPDIIDIRDGGELLRLADSIRSGLQAPPGSRTLPSLLLWNEKGLKHFEAVTYTSDYYLTNAEISVLEAHSAEIAEQMQDGSILLELGSGNLRKVGILLKAIDAAGKHVDYYALDLDRSELERTLSQLGPRQFKHVRCHGLFGTYDDGRAWLSKAQHAKRPKCVLSLGSTIGSMSRDEAARFWSDWARMLRVGGGEASIILGIDGSKDGDKVFRAYNDRDGANKRFIENAIPQANKQLGYEAFKPDEWRQQGEWNAAEGKHDQYLVPSKDVCFEDVRIAEGERVYIVTSVKYDDKEKARLVRASGLTEVERYTNDDGSYACFSAARIRSSTANSSFDKDLALRQLLLILQLIPFQRRLITRFDRIWRLREKSIASPRRSTSLKALQRHKSSPQFYVNVIPPVQQHTELRYGACPTNEDLTTAFNNLPSPRTIYGGMPNHWIFAIRRLPFEPYSTVLVMAHPQSGDVYVLSGNSEADHVCPLLAGDPHAAVALLLAIPLQQQLEMEKFERLDTPLPANAEANQLRAYFSLAKESVVLATATAASLRARGVRESVCNVSVATKKQMQILDQEWLRLASDTKGSLQVQFNALTTAAKETRCGAVLNATLAMR
ncbi:hypothetical protein LTR17_010732 [Elasticomyces elasticus]|nr:hypothetical protein LTR17_010732 [Elasticomyces elasticus]